MSTSTGTPEFAKVNGWTFDPVREVWWAKTGPMTWTEIHAQFDDAPGFRPSAVA